MATVLYQSTQQQTGSGTSVSPAKPASLAVGDILVAHISGLTGAGGANLISAPAGWTQAFQRLANTFFTVAVFTKVADAADVAASTFTFTSAISSFMKGSVSRFTQGSTTAPADQANSGGAGGTTSMASAGITPTQAMGTFLIFAAAFEGSVGTNSVSGYSIVTDNPAAWTEAYDSASNPAGGQSVVHSMAYASRTKLTVSGNVAANLVNTGEYVLGIVNLVPSPIVPGIVASAGIRPSGLRIVMEVAATLLSTAMAATVPVMIRRWRNQPKGTPPEWHNEQKT